MTRENAIKILTQANNWLSSNYKDRPALLIKDIIDVEAAINFAITDMMILRKLFSNNGETPKHDDTRKSN